MGYTGQDVGLSYTFTKSTKTIVFSGYTINSLKDLAVITDVTNGVIIYNFADASTGVFTASTQTLVLTYDTNTVAFNNTDELVINLFTQIGEDVTINSKIVTVLNPANSQYSSPQELVNSTNIAAATNYYADSTGILLQGMRDFSFHIYCSGGVTVTFECTDEIITTPVKWLDCTGLGVVSATVVGETAFSVGDRGITSFVDKYCKVDFDNFNAYKMRVKVVTSDSTNSVYISLISKAF